MTDELLQAALTGAARRDAEPARPESPAEELLPAESDGTGLLLRAGLRDAYRRAGYVPPPAPEPFPPVPDTSETICPAVMVPALWSVLSGGPGLRSVLREVFVALARRGWVLPPGVLVPALSSQVRVPEVLPVLGVRGRWLAGLNEAWKWALAGDREPDQEEVERIWTEGAKGERVALIQRLRATDPAGARERVAAAFASEPADLRRDLVTALEINLTAADEPFLEGALDDRSKVVRQAAAALLARLPESAFVGRMAVRARGMVAGRRLRGGVALQPAPEPPEDWRRDGIGLSPPAGLQEGLARTVEVLCSLPASVVDRELQVSPREVLAAADQYGAAGPLIESWTQSAAPGERETLLPLLWDAWWTKPLQRTAGEGTLILLAREMPPEELRRRLLRLLEDPPAGTERFIVLALNQAGEPWPAELSRAALDLLRRWLDRTLRRERNAGDWPQLIGPLAAHAAPGTINAALELLDRIERAKVLPAWGNEVGQATSVLRLRQRFWDAMAAATMQGC